MTGHGLGPAASLRAKARQELHEFVVLSIYLWICFGAVVFHKYAILHAEGVAYLPLGFAAIKAVVSAKFLMLGRILGLTRGRPGERLILAIARKTLYLVVLLLVLTVIEEVVVALIHGRPLSAAYGELGGTALQAAAGIFLILLILIPYVGFRSLGEVMGEDALHRLLVERRHEQPHER